ncbi:hypothetical protein CHELA1G11_12427 [Hyphomicrobiales bacterium]|nr:hypothetical protein CHELA1G2_11880 [Hyphomicrobiales bacterium]CAH1664760.1 hypothetical protein CHELA1G11_12427 [Hyphomicrobiales bacterium]
MIEQAPAPLADLERSARFLYLQRLSFGGNVAGRIHDSAVGLGLEGRSAPRSSTNLTLRDHACGEFRDEPGTSDHTASGADI